MSLKEMMNKDLEASFNLDEFAIETVHYFAGENEKLNIIFDEATEVVLDKGEFTGVEALVPSLTVPTSKATNITHKSLFAIDGLNYGVIENPKQKDGTTVVYLEKE
jgi:hypothetical protein